MLTSFLRFLEASFVHAPPPPRLKISDKYPDVELRNQFGEPLRFRKQFVDDGRALVINTMYTTCRGSCPGTSSTLKSLRESLSPIFGKRLTIVSVSIDPLIDQPDKLLSYARAFGAEERSEQSCDWQFVTGKPGDIEKLRRALGFFDLNPQIDEDLTQHASTLLVGNSTTDRWMSMPAELKSSQLIGTICRVAGFTFEQKYGIRP